MMQVVLWALGTGFVTGAVWFGILFFRRQQKPALPSPEEADVAKLDGLQRRLLELEERLDVTEYRLTRERAEQQRKPQ